MRTRSLMAAALMVATAAPVAAQRGPRGPAQNDRAAMARPVPGVFLEQQVESALDRREELGLSEGQVTELEALRSEVERTFAPLREEAQAMRSEARDRSGTREEVQERMTALRDRQADLRQRAQTAWEPLQVRFEQVLPPLQRQGLQQRGFQRDGRPGTMTARRQGAVGPRGGGAAVRGGRGAGAGWADGAAAPRRGALRSDRVRWRTR